MEIIRSLYKQVLKQCESKEIALITGPRQCGKTTLMKAVEAKLKQDGHLTLFLNLDFEEDNRHFISQRDLVNKVQFEFGDRKGFVFIDEIQRKENAGLFLKGIYDQDPGWKMIVSGSGSLELKEKIHESLMGRKRLFGLMPVSFMEFLDFKTNYAYSDRLADFLIINEPEALHLFREYINFGGYPAVIMQSSETEKKEVINEIYRSYIERDIVGLLGINRPEAFSKMIQLLAVQSGNIIKTSQLANDVGISSVSIQRYLWYAEKTFVLNRLTPYFANKTKEITKASEFYFNDIGFRNFAVGTFGHAFEKVDTPFVFENYVYLQLKELCNQQHWKLHFWRTTEKAEVDFVIYKGTEILPVEVKYQELKKNTLGRSLHSFIAKYNPTEAWVINLSKNEDLQVRDTIVKFRSWFFLSKKYKVKSTK